jgi:hypothetical protein
VDGSIAETCDPINSTLIQITHKIYYMSVEQEENHHKLVKGHEFMPLFMNTHGTYEYEPK